MVRWNAVLSSLQDNPTQQASQVCNFIVMLNARKPEYKQILDNLQCTKVCFYVLIAQFESSSPPPSAKAQQPGSGPGLQMFLCPGNGLHPLLLSCNKKPSLWFLPISTVDFHRFPSINFSCLYSPGSLKSWIRNGLSRSEMS